MTFRFNKSMQATALLLELAPHQRESYLKIIKLLYIADRESLKETGRTITGDRHVAMKHGPVTSNIYNLIRREDSRAPRWHECIATDHYQIVLRKPPGIGALNKFEVRKLQEVYNRHIDMDPYELAEATHTFEEWIKNDPGNSSRDIPLEDILEAVGRPGEAEKIRREEEQASDFDSFFGIPE